MKWLIPVAFATFVLALAVWLPRERNDSDLLAQTLDTAKEGQSDKKNAPDVGAPDDPDPVTDKADRPAAAAEKSFSDKPPERATKDGPKARPTIEDQRVSDLPDPVDTTADERPMKVFRLEHANARSFSSAIFVLYPEMNDTVNIVTDPRTNSLIVRGPQSALDAIQAIVRVLDNPEQVRRGSPLPPPRLGMAAGPEGGLALDAAQPIDARAAEYRQYELQAAALAKQVRELEVRTKPDDPELQRLKADLQGAVHSAFYARQTAQRAQVKQMRERLDRIDRRVAERGQLANEIIQRRVEELLNPQKQWDIDEDGVATEPAATEPGASDTKPARRQKKTATGRRSAEPPLTDSEPLSPALTTSDAIADPRRLMFDAEDALIASRADVEDAQKTLKFDQENLQRLEELFRTGATTESNVREAERALRATEATLDRARRAVERAERQVRLARDSMASQVKLLELDLADARLKLQQAQDDHMRAKRLAKEQAIAKEEYDRTVLALKQAQLQVERAQTRLDLYRKPLPEAQTRVNKDVNKDVEEK
jgi:hypothetical protein